MEAYLFTNIRVSLALPKERIEEYNERRPYEELQNQTYSEWKQQIQPKLNPLTMSGKRGTYTFNPHNKAV